MKKKERVKSNILFNAVIKQGKKISNKYFSIYYYNNEKGLKLFGVSAPKKIGNAVLRNKLKRQIRQLLDDVKIMFKNNQNYIIIIKEPCIKAKYNEKKQAMLDLIGEINEK